MPAPAAGPAGCVACSMWISPTPACDKTLVFDAENTLSMAKSGCFTEARAATSDARRFMSSLIPPGTAKMSSCETLACSPSQNFAGLLLLDLSEPCSARYIKHFSAPQQAWCASTHATWHHGGTSQHGRNDQHLFPLRAKRAIGHILNVGIVLRATAPLRVVTAGGRVCGACAMGNVGNENLLKRAVVASTTTLAGKSGGGGMGRTCWLQFSKAGKLADLDLDVHAAVACAERRLTTSVAVPRPTRAACFG